MDTHLYSVLPGSKAVPLLLSYLVFQDHKFDNTYTPSLSSDTSLKVTPLLVRKDFIWSKNL
jgi:hypothetical protein